MARKPDMQFFRESGTWHRPEGAARIEVLVKAGDAGGSLDADGTIVPGARGQVVIQEMSAKEAGPTVSVAIGEAGKGAWVGDLKAPDGLPGYAVVTTYFKRHEVLSSLREFCSRIVRHVYAFVIGVVGGVVGVVSAVYADVRPKASALVPLWVWLPLLTGGLLVATFRAFHDVRLERDRATSETKRRFDVMRYALQPAGVPVTLHPTADGKLDIEVGLRLANNAAEYLRYEVEHMTVTIESQTVGNPRVHKSRRELSRLAATMCSASRSYAMSMPTGGGDAGLCRSLWPPVVRVAVPEVSETKTDSRAGAWSTGPTCLRGVQADD